MGNRRSQFCQRACQTHSQAHTNSKLDFFLLVRLSTKKLSVTNIFSHVCTHFKLSKGLFVCCVINYVRTQSNPWLYLSLRGKKTKRALNSTVDLQSCWIFRLVGHSGSTGPSRLYWIVYLRWAFVSILRLDYVFLLLDISSRKRRDQLNLSLCSMDLQAISALQQRAHPGKW